MENRIVKFQAIVRGRCSRLNSLPNSLRMLHSLLSNTKLCLSKMSQDGRTNSNMDEDFVLSLLQKSQLSTRLYIPPPRHWFDFAIYDFQYGWLPVNIKSTTTKTADNTGNFAMCVHALTQTSLEMKRSYQNGEISKIFVQSLKSKVFNTTPKKDYYFIIINKESHEIILNSLKGVRKFTPNIHNLPFQIRWCENKKFEHRPFKKILTDIIETMKKPKPTWQEIFLREMRDIEA